MAVSATINTAPTISSGTATVYPQSNWPYGTAISGSPVGSSVTTGSVGTDGSVTFSGLTASTLYVAYQASPNRYVRFRSPAAAASTGAATLPVTNGLAGWWSAGTLTGSLADGDAVSGLPDSGPYRRDMFQITAAARPLFKAATIGGLPTIRFDGVDDFLASSTFVMPQANHLFIVAQYLNAGLTTLADRTGPNVMRLYRSASTTITAYAGSGLDRTGAAPTTPQVYSALFNGASSELRVNGGTAATGDPGAGSSSAYGMTIGAVGGGGSDWANADVAEVIVFNKALGTADRQLIERYLGAKYGITVA